MQELKDASFDNCHESEKVLKLKSKNSTYLMQNLKKEEYKCDTKYPFKFIFLCQKLIMQNDAIFLEYSKRGAIPILSF